MCVLRRSVSHCIRQKLLNIKSLRIFTKDSFRARNETIYLNKFEIAEAEIALSKEWGWLCFPAYLCASTD